MAVKVTEHSVAHGVLEFVPIADSDEVSHPVRAKGTT